MQPSATVSLVLVLLTSGCIVREPEPEIELPGLTEQNAGVPGGLLAEYHSDRNLGSPRLTRIDSKVGFDWGLGAAHPRLPTDTFSVRWSGFVTPAFSEKYTFYTRSDDGVRLWVNGVKLVDDWTDHGLKENSGTVSLTANQPVKIVLEYYDATEAARVELSWSSARQPREIVPSTRLSLPASSQLPDLVVVSVGWSPAAPLPGEPVTFEAVIRNDGAAAIPAALPLVASFAVDGLIVTWSEESLGALAPGATRRLVARAGAQGVATWAATPGSHNIQGWVDEVAWVAESNEQNNQTAATWTAVTHAAPPLYGYAVSSQRLEKPEPYLRLAAEGGATTVREDINWGGIEWRKGTYDWSKPDRLVETAARLGLRVLMIVDLTPDWASTAPPGTAVYWWYPPANPADYGNFVAQVLSRYGTNGSFWAQHPSVPKLLPAGIEVWNEPNLRRFFTTGPDPVKYTAMLKAAYQAAKAVDPTIPILAGALAGQGGFNDANCDGVTDNGTHQGEINQVNFLQAIYANGGKGYFDAVSVHPYSFGPNQVATQMLSYQPCSGWSQMDKTPTSLRSLMVANGDGDKKIWVTEAGAPTCIAGATYPCVSELEQSNLATQELALWKTYPWAGGFYWYNLQDDDGGASTTDMEQHFGAIRADGKAKPSYAALKAAYTSP